jgi:glycerol-3-phosphate acyltransferase PlsY
MISGLAAIVCGYLIGAVPFGYLVGRWTKGIDVRQYGSGKTGMTNVSRSLGMRFGIFVLLVDAGKGVAAVFATRALTDSLALQSLSATAAVLGHDYPVFLGFKGGRGVSTGLGSLLAISPLVGVVALTSGAMVIGLSRYVSLGSITGTIVGGAMLLLLGLLGGDGLDYALYALLTAPLIVFAHRDNIGRLFRGEERRIGRNADTSPPGASQAGIG